jgi:hypothetical protein
MKIKMNNFIDVVSKILLNLIESSSLSLSNNALVKKDSDENGKTKKFEDLKNKMQTWGNNMIIEDPYSAHTDNKDDKPGSNFDQYGTIRGIVNPLLKNTIMRGVNIDSRYRDDYYDTRSTNLTITLPLVIV